MVTSIRELNDDESADQIPALCIIIGGRYRVRFVLRHHVDRPFKFLPSTNVEVKSSP